MKVLVTGANSLLAANVIRELLQRNIPVRGMLRENSNRKSLDGIQFETTVGNLMNEKDLQKAVSGCTAIIHIAACTSQNADYSTYKKINIEATALTIKVAKKAGIKKYIFVSTANTLGNGSKFLPGNENKPFMKWLKPMGYAYSKFVAEQLVLNEVEQSSFPALIVNPTFIIGPFDAKPSSGIMIQYIYNNRILFYPEGGKNFVPATDAATAIVNALTRGKIGERYLLAGANLSYKEFFQLILKQTEKKSLLIPMPAFILSIAGYIIGFLSKLLSLPTAFNSTSARMLNCKNYYTGYKANTELKMPSTPINVATKDAINWFENNGYLS